MVVAALLGVLPVGLKPLEEVGDQMDFHKEVLLTEVLELIEALEVIEVLEFPVVERPSVEMADPITLLQEEDLEVIEVPEVGTCPGLSFHPIQQDNQFEPVLDLHLLTENQKLVQDLSI